MNEKMEAAKADTIEWAAYVDKDIPAIAGQCFDRGYAAALGAYMRISVQPEWCLDLPIQQQSVLLLAARGPDGIAKAHPCKALVRAYRGSVLIAAKYGRPLNFGEKADSFMSLDEFADMTCWRHIMDLFFYHGDSLPHHYYMHLAHGAEILGYKHPNAEFRVRWKEFYFRCCLELHLNPETEDEMDERLSDWHRQYWT